MIREIIVIDESKCKGCGLRNRITVIGCPKLDSVDYSEKLTAVAVNKNIKSVTAWLMKTCCGILKLPCETAAR